MPKVLLVNKLYHPLIGGVESHVQDLAESLSSEFDLRVLACSESFAYDLRPTTYDLINGIPVYKIPSLGILWSMPIAPTFPFWLKKLGAEADILHFHLPFPLAVLAYFLNAPRATRHAPRLIITWHSDIIRQKIANFFLKPFVQAFLNRADAIIVSSENLKNSSKELAPFKNKCHVVPLGIDISKFSPKPDQTAGDKPFILFVGRLIPYKGLDYLIEAMAQVNGDAKLLLIGEGPLENHLKALVSKYQLQNKVSFLGKISGDSLTPYYQACEFLVLPSITPNEAFGIVQLEAMAAAKPVINTNLPTGVPWVSLNGETGLTVAPANARALAGAITKLLSNTDLRLELGQNARRRVENYFTREKMCEAIAKIYRDLTQV